jgi:TolB-like protein/class 3 adenylate cyclase/tetratricopeptide (TPR) repeat protein
MSERTDTSGTTAERMLVAIMFTDIVGYTSFMGGDERRGIEIRERHRVLTQSLVRKFNGEWIEESGDESLSSFQSAVDAVNCALAIQEETAGDTDLRLRIGMHLGDVVFEGGKVYGDGVNVAARIRPLANPGEVCISAQVYESIRSQTGLRARSLGKRSFKNLDRPVEVFRVARTDSVADSPAHIPVRARWIPRRGAGVAAIVSGLVALALGLGLYERLRPSIQERSSSIAVLPFADMSPNRDQEYFCDGLAEELIHAFSRLEGVRVAARTSSFQFKHKSLDVREIGKRLGVAVVVEGSIRKTDDRLQVTVQLIDVKDGFHRWSKKYERGLEDIFAIQDEIASSVAIAVGATWPTVARAEVPDDDVRTRSALPSRPATPNPEAYDLFLKGRFERRAGTPEGLKRAVRVLKEAVEQDPGYAPAHAEMAEAYTALAVADPSLPPREAYPHAITAASQALLLDDRLPGAHRALAASQFRFDWDWRSAEQTLTRALALEPNATSTRVLYADLLLSTGRYSEAVGRIREALEIEPASSSLATKLAEALVLARRYREARTQLEDALQSEPGFAAAYSALGMLEYAQRRYAEAAAAFRRALALAPGRLDITGFLAAAEAREGNRETAREGLEALRAREREGDSCAGLIALVHAALGEKKSARTWLRKARESRDGWMIWMSHDPRFDSIRADPRAAELLPEQPPSPAAEETDPPRGPTFVQRLTHSG